MIHHTLRQITLRVLFDMLCIGLALAVASWMRTTLSIGTPINPAVRVTPPALYVVAPIVWVLGLYLAQVYNPNRSATLQNELFNLMLGQAGAVLVFLGTLYITFRDYSRLEALYLIVVSFVLLAGQRIVYDRLYRRGRTSARDAYRILIVGVDEMAERLADVILTQQPTQLDLIGFIALDNTPPNALSGRPVLGTLDDLPALVREQQVAELIVTVKWFDQAASERVEAILRQVEPYSVNVRLAPDYSDVTYFHTSAETLYGIPLIGIREPVLTPYERLIKRMIDILLSLLALVVCLPLFALIALAIRLDSPGPVLLRQERVGLRGHLFLMYKFRSMFHQPLNGASPPPSPYNLIKVRDDPRITRVGRWLRRTSLDELPQFVNVLIGDMSLVGPRPEIPSMVDRYEWWQRKRFEVPQGMTGWWQINGRADRPMHYFTGDDLYYIRHYSLWLDLWIMVRTVFVVIFGRGAY